MLFARVFNAQSFHKVLLASRWLAIVVDPACCNVCMYGHNHAHSRPPLNDSFQTIFHECIICMTEDFTSRVCVCVLVIFTTSVCPSGVAIILCT